jgi:hypothetical protein
MISLPFTVILIPYAVVALFVALMSFINIAHLVRNGATNRISFVVTMIFLVGGAGILFGTYAAMQGTDWTQQITFSMPSFTFGTEVGSFNL